MWQKVKKYALLCYRAGDDLIANFGVEMAGYLTFLVLLSLFPYLVLMVAFAGLFGQGEMGRDFINFLLANLPNDAVAALRPRIEEIISGPPQAILTFSILGAIWTSSSAVEAVRSILNRAFRVSKPPAYFYRRLISIGQIFLLTFLILLVMLIFVFAPIVLESISYYTNIQVPLALDTFFTTYFNLIAVVVLFGAVAAFYHVLPNIKQSWAAVFPGAALVVVLWAAAASLMGFYLNDISNVTLIYGSLSGFIATLIFFYVLSLIFIYGAEFNHALMVMRGQQIEEKEHGGEPELPPSS